MHHQWKRLSVTLGALLCGALLTSLVMSWPDRLKQNRTALADELGKPSVAAENLAHAEGLSAAFRSVADSLRPSVVSISIEAGPRQRGRDSQRGPQRGLPPSSADNCHPGWATISSSSSKNNSSNKCPKGPKSVPAAA